LTGGESIAGRNFVTVLGKAAASFFFAYLTKVKYPNKEKLSTANAALYPKINSDVNKFSKIT